MFKDKIGQSLVVSKVSGRRIAGDTVVDNFERLWDAPNWFEDESALALNEVLPGGEVPGSEQGGDLENGVRGNQLDKPSLDNVMNE